MDWQALIDEDWFRYFLLPGLAALAIAIAAWRADHRRMRRADPDAVGWVAWRDVAFWSTAAALLLLAAAFKGWLASA